MEGIERLPGEGVGGVRVRGSWAGVVDGSGDGVEPSGGLVYEPVPCSVGGAGRVGCRGVVVFGEGAVARGSRSGDGVWCFAVPAWVEGIAGRDLEEETYIYDVVFNYMGQLDNALGSGGGIRLASESRVGVEREWAMRLVTGCR